MTDKQLAFDFFKKWMKEIRPIIDEIKIGSKNRRANVITKEGDVYPITGEEYISYLHKYYCSDV